MKSSGIGSPFFGVNFADFKCVFIDMSTPVTEPLTFEPFFSAIVTLSWVNFIRNRTSFILLLSLLRRKKQKEIYNASVVKDHVFVKRKEKHKWIPRRINGFTTTNQIAASISLSTSSNEGKVSSIGTENFIHYRSRIACYWPFFRWIRTILFVGFFSHTSQNLSQSYLSKAFGYLSTCTNIIIAPFAFSRSITMADQDQTKTNDDQQTASVSNATTEPKPNNKSTTDVPDGNRSATTNETPQVY